MIKTWNQLLPSKVLKRRSVSILAEWVLDWNSIWPWQSYNENSKVILGSGTAKELAEKSLMRSSKYNREKLHGLCQLAEHLMEERQLSPCHDGKLQPFLYERGNNVEEKLPLYRESNCLLIIKSTVSHTVIAIKSLCLFSTFWNQLVAHRWSFPLFRFLRRFSSLLFGA